MKLLPPSIGTILKILVHFETEGYTMDDCNFVCEFYGHNQKSIVKTKNDLLRMDEQNYVAIIDTKEIGVGNIKCKLSVDIPDADCPDGTRKEIVRTQTNINIVN